MPLKLIYSASILNKIATFKAPRENVSLFLIYHWYLHVGHLHYLVSHLLVDTRLSIPTQQNHLFYTLQCSVFGLLVVICNFDSTKMFPYLSKINFRGNRFLKTLASLLLRLQLASHWSSVLTRPTKARKLNFIF